MLLTFPNRESVSEESIECCQNASKRRGTVGIPDFQAHRQAVVNESGLIWNVTTETASAAICHIFPSLDHVVVAVSEILLSIMVEFDKEMFQLSTNYLTH